MGKKFFLGTWNSNSKFGNLRLLEKIVVNSLMKNKFYLYHRLATSYTLTEETERVNSQLKLIVRPMYSNPPIYGAKIVSEILCDSSLRGEWVKECKGMADRIINMRKRQEIWHGKGSARLQLRRRNEC